MLLLSFLVALGRGCFEPWFAIRSNRTSDTSIWWVERWSSRCRAARSPSSPTTTWTWSSERARSRSRPVRAAAGCLLTAGLSRPVPALFLGLFVCFGQRAGRAIVSKSESRVAWDGLFSALDAKPCCCCRRRRRRRRRRRCCKRGTCSLFRSDKCTYK